jgi:CTD small phosphatase-like protein 2
LRIFEGLSLSEVVLIDNSVYSFAHQIENGVPIIPFYTDRNDEELLHLIKYMEGVAACRDIREYNREAFGLQRLALEVANESSSSEGGDEYQSVGYSE